MDFDKEFYDEIGDVIKKYGERVSVDHMVIVFNFAMLYVVEDWLKSNPVECEKFLRYRFDGILDKGLQRFKD